jgi:hypothetical protein
MKNIVIGILLIAALAFGGLYLRQTHKARQAQASADGSRQKISELQSSLDEQEKQKTQLSDQLEASRTAAAANAPAESQTNQAPADVGQTNAKPSNPLAEMLKNPEMKEMIKNQQKTALGAMIDKNYGKLFADLNLTPEQSAALKEQILNKQLQAADMGMSMFTDDLDAAKRAELVKQVKTANDAADAQIKELLGDEAYKQFQTYEKSMGERMTVSGFTDQLSSGSTALADDQQQQLIQAMTQARQDFKFTTDYSDQSKFDGDFTSMFTEDRMNVFFQELEQLNQQYLARAQSILSPDQFEAFKKYLANQQAMQKMGMQMAGKMFAPAKSGSN